MQVCVCEGRGKVRSEKSSIKKAQEILWRAFNAA